MTAGTRICISCKYTFLVVLVLCVLVGTAIFAAPTPHTKKEDWYKHLMSTMDNWDRCLTFLMGCIATSGLWHWLCYTSVGLAVVPVQLLMVSDRSGISMSTKQQQEAERARTDALAITAYNVVHKKTLTLWPASLRASGRDIEKFRAELNRGALTSDSYSLKLLKSGLDATVEDRIELTDRVTFSLGSSEVTMTRNGHFLKQLHVFCGKAIASGLDEITPDTANPKAGSQGDHGDIKVSSSSGQRRNHDTTAGDGG